MTSPTNSERRERRSAPGSRRRRSSPTSHAADTAVSIANRGSSHVDENGVDHYDPNGGPNLGGMIAAGGTAIADGLTWGPRMVAKGAGWLKDQVFGKDASAEQLGQMNAVQSGSDTVMSGVKLAAQAQDLPDGAEKDAMFAQARALVQSGNAAAHDGNTALQGDGGGS